MLGLHCGSRTFSRCCKQRLLFVVMPGHLWRRQWHPTSVLLPGKSHGWRSLVGCSPWGHSSQTWLSDFTFTFSFSCTGKGNGNPLQCSCLENPRGRRAWWAAVYGVTQSWTWLKRLSSSRASHHSGFSGWRAQALGLIGSVVVVHRLSSWTRDWISFPYSTRRTPNHLTTKERPWWSPSLRTTAPCYALQ